MSITIVPFRDEHREAAAELLAARQRSDRIASPELPACYEDATAACTALQASLGEEGIAGVVALRGRQAVGFLLGAPVLGAPTRAFAGFMRPRSGEVFYDSHAVDPAEREDLYRHMYAALAERWLRAGLPAHYVTIPAHPATVEAWADLGFGRYIDMGVRDTREGAASPAGGAGIEMRRAGPEDYDAIQALSTELFRSFADPPNFVPFLAETAAARQQFQAELLADAACPHWLAFANGRVSGMLVFVEPTSSQWHLGTLQAPERAVYLFLACTLPEARGTGIGAALFAHSMVWAREAGYERCVLHYLTSSRAARFWRGLGFRPVSHWMSRVVDERTVWAHGWA